MAVDRAFGRLLNRFDDDATVIVASDHGCGSGWDDLSLNRLLAEWGYLKLSDEAPQAKGVASWFASAEAAVQWQSTRAYSPVPGAFGINLNLRGRQACGAVSATEAEGLLQDLEQRCRELRSPRDGAPVFASVLRGEEAYPGPYVRDAVDLLLVPRDERTILSCHVSGDLWRPSYQTGLHRYEGLWMMRSPKTVAGALPTPMRIVDVAPTLAGALGMEPPRDVDGRCREDVFGRGHLENGGDACADRDQGTEDALVSERLRAMGYM